MWTESNYRNGMKQGMGEITFVIRAEPTEVLGYVTLAEDDIEVLMAASTEGAHILARP